MDLCEEEKTVLCAKTFDNVLESLVEQTVAGMRTPVVAEADVVNATGCDEGRRRVCW